MDQLAQNLADSSKNNLNLHQASVVAQMIIDENLDMDAMFKNKSWRIVTVPLFERHPKRHSEKASRLTILMPNEAFRHAVADIINFQEGHNVGLDVDVAAPAATSTSSKSHPKGKKFKEEFKKGQKRNAEDDHGGPTKRGGPSCSGSGSTDPDDKTIIDILSKEIDKIRIKALDENLKLNELQLATMHTFANDLYLRKFHYQRLIPERELNALPKMHRESMAKVQLLKKKYQKPVGLYTGDSSKTSVGDASTSKDPVAKGLQDKLEGRPTVINNVNILIESLFDMAKSKKPSVIFIDEIDLFFGDRSDDWHEATKRIKNEFLINIQGIEADNEGVVLLGATNRPWDMDKAFERRFQKRIFVTLPSEHTRIEMFKLNVGYCPNCLTDENFKYLGRVTEGYSGSDIAVTVAKAVNEPVRKVYRATHFRKVLGPSPSNALELVYLWTPCSPDEPGATRMSPNDASKNMLIEPLLLMSNFLNILESTKQTIDAAELRKFENYARDHGENG